jgi:acetyl esterase/lipase
MKKEKFVRAYLNATPLPLDDIVEARQMENRRAAMAARVQFSGAIDNIEIDTEAGSSKVKIYTPHGTGPFPAILYMHGGGFSIGSPDTSDNLCRTIAESAEAVLISVDYRLAPEHKFPTALEECYQVALWIMDNDVALNIRSDQLTIAGDSAGGNLAAAICLMAQTRQEFSISQQVLICPMLDQSKPHRDKITSMEDPLLTSENCQTFSRYYFSDPDDSKKILASPLLAEDLTALPPAIIITAELDPLSTEAIQYGEKLRQAGVEIIHHHYQGQVHDFPLFIKSLDDAKKVAEKIGHYLAEKFSAH